MPWSPTFRTLRALALCALAVSLPAGPTVGAGGSPPERSTIAFRTGQTGQRQLPVEPVARRNATEPGIAALDYDGNASPRVAQQVRIAEAKIAAPPVVLDATPQVVVGRMMPSADELQSNSPDRSKTDKLFGIATEGNQARSVGVVFGASSAERSRRDSRNVSQATTGRELVYTSTGPAVRVDARGPREVNVGVPARYTLTLHNQSATDARGVFVRVTLGNTVEVASVDASAGEIQRSNDASDQRHLVWMFDRLPAQSSPTLDMQFTPTAGHAVELHVEWTFLPLGESMQIVTLRPELRLAVDGPEQAVLGEKPLYTVSVENRGNTAAEDVVVELSTTGGRVKSVPLGSIPAGDTMQFQIELARLSAGPTKLSAVAAAAHGLREKTSLAIDVLHVALEATASGPTSRLAGNEATYQLEVRNTGSAPARNVIASVLLPQGIAPVTIPPSAYKLGDRIAWQVGDLEPDAARGYVFECELVEPGEYTVDFRVADAGENRVEANLRTTVEATADVRMSVALDDAKIPVGQSFTYTIELENRGTMAAELLDVAVDLAVDVEPVNVEGATTDSDTGRVAFAPIASLQPGERRQLTLQARGSVTGQRSFRVEASTPDGQVRLAQEGSTRFFVAGEPLANVDVRVESNHAKVAVGEELVYEIRLDNRSEQAAEDVQVVMHFARGVEPVSMAGGAGQITGGTVTFEPFERLEQGAPRVVSITAIAHRPGSHTYRAEVTTAADARLACEGTTGCFLPCEPGDASINVARQRDTVIR